VFPEWIGDMKFNENALHALLRAKPEFIVIVSNQDGIELGYIKQEYFEAKISFITNAMEEWFKKYGAEINVIGMFCGSNDKSNIYRKPNPGLLEMIISRKFKDNYQKYEMLMI
jgi:histidinol phosphatase-like enzyme